MILKKFAVPSILLLLLTLLASGSIASAEGNPVAGQKIYNTCKNCHALAENRTGPRHCGLLGRAAGTEKGFNFSTQMKNSGLVWDVATLDQFIVAPSKLVPGTTMAFAGIENQAKRTDLIAYLVQASQSKKLCSGKKKKKSDK